MTSDFVPFWCQFSQLLAQIWQPRIAERGGRSQRNRRQARWACEVTGSRGQGGRVAGSREARGDTTYKSTCEGKGTVTSTCMYLGYFLRPSLKLKLYTKKYMAYDMSKRVRVLYMASRTNEISKHSKLWPKEPFIYYLLRNTRILEFIRNKHTHKHTKNSINSIDCCKRSIIHFIVNFFV